MSNMREFIGHLKQFNDAARSDRFRVFLDPPPALQSKYANISRRLGYQCESSELPGRTLSTFDTRTYGPTVRSPYQATYSDLPLTFFCMGNMSGDNANGLIEKVFFDDWLEVINPSPNSIRQGQYNIGYKEDYVTTISVEHYDTNGALTYGVDFIDAFPLATNQLTLTWSDESIMKLTVPIAFTRWERYTSPFQQASLSGESFNTAQKPDITGDQLKYPNQGVEEELGIRPVTISGLKYENQGLEESLGLRK